MFEQTFKNIDDKLWKDAGCSSELDYVEQTSWILFLKYLDDLEKDRKDAAELMGKSYTPIITGDFRWDQWAVRKTKEGKTDHHRLMTGDDLTVFVNEKLFPYLRKFRGENPNTIEYKIGEIFSELKNKIQSGYNLREVINLVDELRFRSSKEKHEMSALYEDKIKNMGNAGRNGGEYYTPRPLIRAIVKVVAPKIGETVYDGAVGSAGFLVEAWEYLRGESGVGTKEAKILQEKTFYGKEKKSLAYIIGTMNMILHGIEAPNILHTNTLAEDISDIQERDRYHVVLANPPFGGKERAEVQNNFPIKTGETAFLFLQHFIKILKAGGRAGIVIKNTFLSNTDNASVSLRRQLLETCNLHTVLDLPGGVFTGAGVKTVVLFFDKGSPPSTGSGQATKKIWYYQLNLERNLGKTNPLNDADLADFVKLYASRASATEGPETPNSWNVDAREAAERVEADLSVKNPHRKADTTLRAPAAILAEMKSLDEDGAKILKSIEKML
ncbi:MAG: type I restriction endonuclease subunit M [Anaerolineae bacterium]|nr:MAG: type I restriction endonuclease subunit M [Anaerolineae bacterium]WKZ45295.1 MAG: N-6 DNA methylase [Anaerolineales bacterium]